jgi:hypothetical protein
MERDESVAAISPTTTWRIHVCPLCGFRVDLRFRRPEDVRCYGFAGDHPGTPVKEIVVAEVPHA